MQVEQSEMDEFIQEDYFYHYFQPIFCLERGERQGMEALLRAKKGTPDLIFEHAKKTKRLYELDIKSIYKALTTCYSAGYLNREGLLFLNVFPSTLLNPNFPQFVTDVIEELMPPCQQIVFELNETEQTFGAEQSILLKERIAILKDYGFLIAIDDVGKGWSSLSTLIDLEPHFAKLDLYFSRNLSVSKKKQAMIQALIQYCSSNCIKLILEGIEEEIDLDMAKTLGVHFGQGYLLGKPQLLDV
ncbi:EAL domain-containing protein [Aneurinibacillus sp. Ricciae_BoGa-3]|uniref:EAL domain-containing protein n=1 Tax=Aneurinibacillus sp. Ricciae_BoGa-3 TaxID=3022697 RepID=UPI0023414343|nr:EAL domain-containing protein [Aneurinibacillus sp. Ricciae_BoGa-3]WCK53805.1 EAL domain-containing protein [Aneurinibacillus sp. Ricciae_BoGa-3]